MIRDLFDLLGVIWLAMLGLAIVVTASNEASHGALGALVFDWIGL